VRRSLIEALAPSVPSVDSQASAEVLATVAERIDARHVHAIDIVDA
jgi:D-3-phosphoglycerate dehydrogenase